MAADNSRARDAGFTLGHASMHPHPALYRGAPPATLRFGFQAGRPVDLRVAVVRRATGAVVWSTVERDASPSEAQRVRWEGVWQNGHPAPPDAYRFRVGKLGHYLHQGPGFRLRGHAFPVRGRHWDRGYWGQFGAPREGGRTHEGYDVMAPCGTQIVATRAGRVDRRDFDPELDGNYLRIHARGERRSYLYAHLGHPASVALGERVRTGQAIGTVGKTGNAADVGCHLHNEFRARGHLIDPKPALRRWDRWS